ncbi:MAG: hypothetical protein ACYC3X_02365 [Pirellulaceae bacterium]
MGCVMWQIDRATAEWKSNRLRATIDLARPTYGLQQIAIGGTLHASTQVLQVSVPNRGHHAQQCVEDAYVRGADVIVTYAATAHSPLQPQVCWRVLDEPSATPAIVLEAIVSIQTCLLDSDPRIQLASTLAGEHWLQSALPQASGRFCALTLQDQSPRSISVDTPGIAILARMPESAWCYGHFVHAADLLDANVTWDRSAQLSTLSTLFCGQRLEKGVLRRVRARAVLVPREQDEMLVEQLWVESARAAPPLAT